MSKKTRTERKTSTLKQKIVKVDENMGRPTDNELENYFMTLLKKGKLQAIDAQSMAQLECSSFPDSTRELALKGIKDDVTSMREKVKWILNWFDQIDQPRFELLRQSFNEGLEKWEYKIVRTIEDFPKYLFLDELDLSYVLKNVLTSKIPELLKKDSVTNDELLFFVLLCFASRDMISFRILQSLKPIYGQILENMNGLKEKVEESLKESDNSQQKKGTPQMKVVIIQTKPEPNEQQLDVNLRRGEFYLEMSPDFEKEESANQVEKTKKIKKEKKEEKQKKEKKEEPARGRGRPKIKEANLQMRNSLNPEDIAKILQKLFAYIFWSYRYIYSVELEKKAKLNLND